MITMKTTHKLMHASIIMAFAGILGCATAMKEIETEKIDTDPTDTVIHAKIVNIVQVKKDASLLKQLGGSLIGATIGSQIGGGSTQYIVGTSAAFLGQDVVNKITANIYR
jgi:outer membrane lipoprotein SlyB